MDYDYNYKFSPIAYQDIDSTIDYIKISLDNPIAADSLLKRIKEAVRKICTFPYAYPDCRIYSVTNQDYRRAVLGGYVLIFHIAKKTQTIEIVRFLYAGTDVRKTLNLDD